MIKKINHLFIDIDKILVPFFIERISLYKTKNFLIKVEGIDSEIKAKKFLNHEIYFSNDFKPINFEKTKDLVKIFDKYGWQSLLIIDEQEKAKGLAKFIKRLANRDVLSVNGINVYDILRKDQLLITSAALKQLEEKLQ